MKINSINNIQNTNFTSIFNKTKATVLSYDTASGKYEGDVNILYLIKTKGLNPQNEAFLFSGIDENSKRYVIFSSISEQERKANIFKLVSSDTKYTKEQMQAINLFKNPNKREQYLLPSGQTPFDMRTRDFSEKEFFGVLKSVSDKKQKPSNDTYNDLITPNAYDRFTKEKIEREFTNPKYTSYVIKNSKNFYLR